jgi:hypothetical protein
LVQLAHLIFIIILVSSWYCSLPWQLLCILWRWSWLMIVLPLLLPWPDLLVLLWVSSIILARLLSLLLLMLLRIILMLLIWISSLLLLCLPLILVESLAHGSFIISLLLNLLHVLVVSFLHHHASASI